MVDYSRQNNAYVERLRKELWSKGEMLELQQKLKDTKLAKKYGLVPDKDQQQTGQSKFDFRKFNQSCKDD
jgi:hypothetical protein